MERRGFIFDMNGTIIDDMPWHTRIWNTLFNELGAGHTLDQTKAELYGKNSEILERIFPGRFTAAEKDALEEEKEKRYRQLYKEEMQLVKGLDIFLKRAFDRNIAIGIGTAAIKPNVDFILDGLHIRKYFSAIVSAEDVTISKPHPETFLKCASLLKINAASCVVFEDSPKGVETAKNAGMRCVVLTTMHKAEEFTGYDNIEYIVQDYTDPGLENIL